MKIVRNVMTLVLRIVRGARDFKEGQGRYRTRRAFPKELCHLQLQMCLELGWLSENPYPTSQSCNAVIPVVAVLTLQPVAGALPPRDGRALYAAVGPRPPSSPLELDKRLGQMHRILAMTLACR